MVRAERELQELYALAEGPANKKQRLQLPAIGDDSMELEDDTPLVLRKAKAEAERQARKAGPVQQA